MDRVKNIIVNHKDVEFVVHTQNVKEINTLIDILEELNFEYTIPVKSLRKFADDFIKENGYSGGWRISKTKGAAYNPSINYWKQYYGDIIEIKNGEICYV